MAQKEGGDIFERIEALKVSTQKYIQDVANLIKRINEGYVVKEKNCDEAYDDEFEFHFEYDNHQHDDVPQYEDDDLYAFLMETFDLHENLG